MNPQQVYGLSPAGEHELRSGSTTLPPTELELLVRIDPSLTLDQVRASMPVPADAEFERALRQLIMRGFIQPVQLDDFALQLQAGLDSFGSVQGEDADAGVRSLKRSGYFVRIARHKADVPPRAIGHVKTAVLVEDDPHLAGFVRTYLSFDGFAVRVASNREQVLAEFRKPPVPDLVLLDVVLPDVDGFEVLASLRKHAAFRQVPVIMLTGKASREAVLKGMQGGADGYVTKPFEPDALMSAVHTVLGTDGD